MSLQLVTVSSHIPTLEYYCYEEHFKSAKEFGCDVINLCQEGEYLGLISKLKILQRRLNDGLISSEYLLFADCWDSIYTDDPAKAIDILKSYNVDILFNAEKGLFPRTDLFDKFPDQGTPYRYLNSGVFIGKVGAIRQFLEELNLHSIPDDHQVNGQWVHSNDQGDVQGWFTSTGMNVALDTQCKLCQTLHNTGWDEVEIIGLDERWRIKNKITGEAPLILHGNGGGKESEPMVEFLKRWREGSR